MNIYSKLKYPPLQNLVKRKLPDILIYQKQHKLSNKIDINVDEFVAFSTKNASKWAKMKCVKAAVSREDCHTVMSLYVWLLKSQVSGCGLGSTLLKFAKKHSEKVGCNGYFHLCAVTHYDPDRIPHIFYRKFGMSSAEQSIDNKLDDFVKRGVNATENDFGPIDMFYPPILHTKSSKKTTENGFIKKVKNIFKITRG